MGRRWGHFPEIIEADSLDEASYGRHRRTILDYLGFRAFDAHANAGLIEHIRPMVRSQARPKFILLRAIEFLEQRKTEVPTLRAWTDIILGEVQRHRLELMRSVDETLRREERQLLDDLLEKPDEEDAGKTTLQRYRLTLLKRISQSTKVSRIRATVDDLLTLRELFHWVQSVGASLDLSYDGVRYYANTVVKSRIFQVARRQEKDRYLHLVCFIAHQYLRKQDTLVDILLQSAQTAVNACRRLIENTIIFWNYLYLSQRILNEEDEERLRDLIAAIRTGSVVARQQINLRGEYDLADEKLQDSVGLDVPKIRELTGV